MAIKINKTIGGGNRSATATFDYISRSVKGQEEVLAEGFSHLPLWATNERSFWRAADNHERKGSANCTHNIIALPRETTMVQNIEAIKTYVESHLKDVPVSWRIHRGDNAEPNPHVHIIFSQRSRGLGRFRLQKKGHDGKRLQGKSEYIMKPCTEKKNMKVWNTKSETPKKQFFKRNGAKKNSYLTEKAGLSDSSVAWVKAINPHLPIGKKLPEQNKHVRDKSLLVKLNPFQKETYTILPQWRMDRACQYARNKAGKDQELFKELRKDYELIQLEEYNFYMLNQNKDINSQTISK